MPRQLLVYSMSCIIEHHGLRLTVTELEKHLFYFKEAPSKAFLDRSASGMLPSHHVTGVEDSWWSFSIHMSKRMVVHRSPSKFDTKSCWNEEDRRQVADTNSTSSHGIPFFGLNQLLAKWQRWTRCKWRNEGVAAGKTGEEIELGLIFDRQDRRFGGKTNERIVVLDPLPLSPSLLLCSSYSAVWERFSVDITTYSQGSVYMFHTH